MKKRIMISMVSALVTGFFLMNPISASAKTLSVNLDSGADRGGIYIGVDQSFTTQDGAKYSLIMSGLKTENADRMLKAVEDNCSSIEAGNPLKVIDPSFVDAEKWDNGDFSSEENDSAQCWTASISNMLTISGWTKWLGNDAPVFNSEDEIFRLFNKSFIDKGGDSDRGLDWFFMGEFCMPEPGLHSDIIDERTGGYLPRFVSSLAQKKYDLIKDASMISALEECGKHYVFEGSVGPVLGDEFSGSDHSITVAGVMIDPSRASYEERYRAIVIIDSDNDAKPGDEEIARVEAGKATRSEIKAERPNSYTVYPLRPMTDGVGKKGWEILGYAEEGSKEVLYELVGLPLPSKEIIEQYSESLGSCDIRKDADFTLDDLYMTDDQNGSTDPYFPPYENRITKEFPKGAPVYLNYYVTNRGRNNITAYEDGRGLSLDWTLERADDGSVVSKGSHTAELPMLSGYNGGSEKANIINLNEDGSLPSGRYRCVAELNASKTYPESYYLNNEKKTLYFEVLPDKADGVDDAGSDEAKSGGKVFRLYNPDNGDHLLTRSEKEREFLCEAGWEYEDSGDISAAYDEDGALPVYRLFDQNRGMHHFTADKREADALKALGWNHEGEAFYAYGSDFGSGRPQHRVFNPNNGQHHYTTDMKEKDCLVSHGWDYEGVAWKMK